MTTSEAESTADAYIKLILQHQPDPLGRFALVSKESAQKSAQSIAAFREELIKQLTQQ